MRTGIIIITLISSILLAKEPTRITSNRSDLHIEEKKILSAIDDESEPHKFILVAYKERVILDILLVNGRIRMFNPKSNTNIEVKLIQNAPDADENDLVLFYIKEDSKESMDLMDAIIIKRSNDNKLEINHVDVKLWAKLLETEDEIKK